MHPKCLIRKFNISGNVFKVVSSCDSALKEKKKKTLQWQMYLPCGCIHYFIGKAFPDAG